MSKKAREQIARFKELDNKQVQEFNDHAEWHCVSQEQYLRFVSQRLLFATSALIAIIETMLDAEDARLADPKPEVQK